MVDLNDRYLQHLINKYSDLICHVVVVSEIQERATGRSSGYIQLNFNSFEELLKSLILKSLTDNKISISLLQGNEIFRFETDSLTFNMERRGDFVYAFEGKEKTLLQANWLNMEEEQFKEIIKDVFWGLRYFYETDFDNLIFTKKRLEFNDKLEEDGILEVMISRLLGKESFLIEVFNPEEVMLNKLFEEDAFLREAFYSKMEDGKWLGAYAKNYKFSSFIYKGKPVIKINDNGKRAEIKNDFAKKLSGYSSDYLDYITFSTSSLVDFYYDAVLKDYYLMSKNKIKNGYLHFFIKRTFI
jgi:hypothetical protein